MSDIELKLDGLHSIIRAVKNSEKTYVKIGILGSHGARNDGSGKTNSEIGAIHEFGGAKMPQRSFIRMPISQMLNKELEKGGSFTPDALKKVIDQKSMVPYLEKIGIAGEAVISDAFATRGFGQWKMSNMSRKEIKQTLVESWSLRDSITYEVIEGE